VHKIREEAVSVILSELLEEAGVTNVSLLNMGGIPDIYLLARGVRIILETKERGHSAALQKQLEERIEKNLCDVAVGLEYPISMVTGSLSPPTTKDVRERLLKEKLLAKALTQGAIGYRMIFENKETKTSELPELLISVTGEIMPLDELEQAINFVRDAISHFTKNTSTLPNAKSLGEVIMEELEIGQE
jgi:hypothetical protein